MKDNNTNEVTTLAEILSDELIDKLLAEARRTSIAESRRRGLSHADAEDTAQSVTLKLWQMLTKRKHVKSVEAWTRTATRNYLANQYRDGCRLKRGAGLVESLTDVTEDRFARN